MRKIISILLALGMILALSAVAVPTAAQTCTATVTLSSDCASEAGVTYIITFVSPVTLLAGNDKLSFDFATGTTFGTFVLTDITVNDGGGAVNVPVANIATSAARLEFLIPATVDIDAGDTVTVIIKKVVNTAVDGDYELGLDYEFACCGPEDFDCAEYTIIPAISTLDLILDFGPTYSGIAEGFTPPFKASGQNMTTTVYNATIGGFVEPFNLILRANPVGCAPPCTNATMWFVLEECPTGEVVTLSFNGTWYTLVATGVPATTDVGIEYPLPNVLMTPPPPDVVWNNWIHFSSPGDYELCFYLECPAVGCPTCAGPTVVATECLDAVVYQWKDAYKIELDPKWNLISLPLFPFDTDIADVLASIDRIDQLMSVWYFGQCEPANVPNTGTWHTEVYDGTFTPNTMDIEAGKAYWLRMKHPGDVGYNASLFPVNLWVFGNHASMPPANPMGYFDVCDGWNMVGFKAPWTGLPLAPTPQANNQYLWNFNTAVIDTVHYGLIYDWVEATQDWTYIVPGAAVLNPGDGYWIPFDGDGEIYPAP